MRLIDIQRRTQQCSNHHHTGHNRQWRNKEDMDDINGIPPDISPILIETIKAQKKLLNLILKHCKQQSNNVTGINTAATVAATTTTSTITAISHNNSNQSEGLSGEGIKNDILHRMEQQEQKDKEQQILNSIPPSIKVQAKVTSESINTFIERLNLEEQKSKNYKRGSSTCNSNDLEIYDSITISSMIFCLEVVQEIENKLILRLAAILITSSIIHQTNNIYDVITFLLSRTRSRTSTTSKFMMKQVIDSVNNCSGCCENTNVTSVINDLLLLEIWHIFTFMKLWNKNKDYEPTIIVTLRYLEEQKGLGTINITTPSSLSSLSEFHGDAYKKGLDLFLMLSSSSSTTTISSFNNASANNYNQFPNHKLLMNEKRNIRDIALKHGDKEIQRLDKILKCINDCIEIIVPRFAGHEEPVKNNDRDNHSINSAPTSSANGNLNQVSGSGAVIDNNDGDNDDNNKDEIDWEDGDDDELFFTSQNDESKTIHNKERFNQTNHIAAVEHSIAMMKETGALNQDGNLQVMVDFSSSSALRSDTVDSNFGSGTAGGGTNGESEEKHASIQLAKTKLNKCIKCLSDRHQPRLDAWVNALISADNMTTTITQRSDSELLSNNYDVRNDMNNASIVLLPLAMREKKALIVRTLTEYKSKVVSALALAAKLGVQTNHGTSEIVNDETPSERVNGRTDYQHQVATLPATTVQQSTIKSNIVPWQQALGIQSSGGRQIKKVESLSSPLVKRKKNQNAKSRLQIKLRKS